MKMKTKFRKLLRPCLKPGEWHENAVLQTIGNYQPYDVVDPNTWNKKAKKKKRRDSAGLQSASTGSGSSLEQEISAESSEMDATSPLKQDRRASEPNSSLHDCEQKHIC